MDIHQPKLLMEAYLDVYRGQEDNSDSFDQVVDFLISEGYAEDLEDAIDLIEELDDEEIEGILDEEAKIVMSVTSPTGKQRRLNTTKATGLAKPMADVRERQDFFNDIERKRKNKDGLDFSTNSQQAAKNRGQVQISTDRHNSRYTRSRVPYLTRALQRRYGISDNALDPIKENVDLYDLVLDHLLDEGYADSEQDALQIMSNMSEEWVEDILEAFKPLRRDQLPGVVKANKKAVKDFAFHASKITRHSPLPGQSPRKVTPAQKAMLDRSFKSAKTASKFGDSTKKALEGRDPKPRS